MYKLFLFLKGVFVKYKYYIYSMMVFFIMMSYCFMFAGMFFVARESTGGTGMPKQDMKMLKKEIKDIRARVDSIKNCACR